MPTLTQLESRLRNKFTKAELEDLENQARFVSARNGTRTDEGFLRLCEVGEEILKVRHNANTAARQFRYGVATCSTPARAFE